MDTDKWKTEKAKFWGDSDLTEVKNRVYKILTSDDSNCEASISSLWH